MRYVRHTPALRWPEQLHTLWPIILSIGGWQKNGEGGKEEGKGMVAGGAIDYKLRDDMELVLAALVDFRREMKGLSKKVQHLTDTDGRNHTTYTTTKNHPGFLE